VILHDVDDFAEWGGRLEALIAERAGHLAAHLGMLCHGQDEMRFAFRRRLADHSWAPSFQSGALPALLLYCDFGG
jgi:hypothetical protein